MSRFLIIVGRVWLYLAAFLILLSYISILYSEGFRELAAILSPFNVWNVVAVAITLLPGIGLLELGKRLDRRTNKGVAQPPLKQGEQYDGADVLQKYGAVLQARGSLISDISELPYPKDVIRSVLCHCIKVTTDGHAKEQLKIACLALADFQPLTPAEREALSVMANTSSTPEDVVKVADSYAALLQRSKPERDEISRELGISP